MAPRVQVRSLAIWGTQQVGGPASGFCIVWPGVSDDTALRHLKRHAQSTARPPRAVGIDDWSWRNTHTYGTVLVDLERRGVIDFLADRSVESCAGWLRQYPEIEVVGVDRCGQYAKAASRGAPQAAQVADQFHIMQNLRHVIAEQMNIYARVIGRALFSDAENIRTANYSPRPRLACRHSSEEIFKSIHALRKQGLSFSEIGRRTGSPRRSVAKQSQSEVPPDRRRARLKPTSPWYFAIILADLRAQGGTGLPGSHDRQCATAGTRAGPEIRPYPFRGC